MIKISVPGKIHLLGEHSVVYGKPALLTSINLRVFVTVTTDSPSPSLRAHSEAISTNGSPTHNVLGDDTRGKVKEIDKKLELLQKVIEKEFIKKFPKIKIPKYKLQIISEFPIGSGLGASAAISVGLTKALLKYLKIKADKSAVFEIALEGEKLFHGNASGGDVAAVLNEGLTWFVKQSEKTKIIKPLSFSISKKLQNFFLIDSGKPVETTKEMVEKVKRLILKSPPHRHIFDEQEKLTKKLVEALKTGNSALMIQIIRAGEKNLEKLGVVGKKAKKIIREIEKIGGAAKISGAGGIKEGSGMILAYHTNSSKIHELAKKNNWKVLKIKLGDDLKT